MLHRIPLHIGTDSPLRTSGNHQGSALLLHAGQFSTQHPSRAVTEMLSSQHTFITVFSETYMQNVVVARPGSGICCLRRCRRMCCHVNHSVNFRTTWLTFGFLVPRARTSDTLNSIFVVSMRMRVHSKWSVAGGDSGSVTTLCDSRELTAAATCLRQRTDFRPSISRRRWPVVNIYLLTIALSPGVPN